MLGSESTEELDAPNVTVTGTDSGLPSVMLTVPPSPSVSAEGVGASELVGNVTWTKAPAGALVPAEALTDVVPGATPWTPGVTDAELLPAGTVTAAGVTEATFALSLLT